MKNEINVTANGGELTIREGKALELKEPRLVNITGVLNSPLRWLEKKIDAIDQICAHILVDRDKLSITLNVDENDYYQETIKGVLELHPDFRKFQINTGHQFNNFELAELFKMNRAAFESPSTAMKLVTELKNFKAKVDKEIEKANNDRGAVKLLQQQAVESNLPEKFNLNISIFKGQPNQIVDVEIYIDPSSLNCSMVSPAANDLITEIRDAAIDEVLENIIEVAPDIVILEQ